MRERPREAETEGGSEEGRIFTVREPRQKKNKSNKENKSGIRRVLEKAIYAPVFFWTL